MASLPLVRWWRLSTLTTANMSCPSTISPRCAISKTWLPKPLASLSPSEIPLRTSTMSLILGLSDQIFHNSVDTAPSPTRPEYTPRPSLATRAHTKSSSLKISVSHERSPSGKFFPFPFWPLLFVDCAVSHRLTGWNAVKSRGDQLKLKLTDAQVCSSMHLVTCRFSNSFFRPRKLL
jgi:hypothetical protein